MRKSLIYIIICLTAVLIRVLFESIPYIRYPLQIKVCENIEEVFQYEEMIGFASYLEEVEVEQIRSFKKELCR